MKIELDLPEIEGYEYTGEYRTYRKSEWYLTSNGLPELSGGYSDDPYPILKKKAPKYDVIVAALARNDSFKYVEIKALEDALELSSGMIMTDCDIAIYKELYSLIN